MRGVLGAGLASGRPAREGSCGAGKPGRRRAPADQLAPGEAVGQPRQMAQRGGHQAAWMHRTRACWMLAGRQEGSGWAGRAGWPHGGRASSACACWAHRQGQGWQLGAGQDARDGAEDAGELLDFAAVGMAHQQAEQEQGGSRAARNGHLDGWRETSGHPARPARTSHAHDRGRWGKNCARWDGGAT